MRALDAASSRSLGAAAQQAAVRPPPSAAAPPVISPANDPGLYLQDAAPQSRGLRRSAGEAGGSARPRSSSARRADKHGGFPVYLSIQTSRSAEILSYIPRDRLIVTVSNRAHRAGAVGDILAGLGYHVVGAIGVLDYQDEGGALTKIAPPRRRNRGNEARRCGRGQMSALRNATHIAAICVALVLAGPAYAALKPGDQRAGLHAPRRDRRQGVSSSPSRRR